MGSILTTKEIAQKINERVRERVEELRTQASSYQRQTLEKLREIDKVEENITTFYGVIALLEAAGFTDYRTSTWTDSIYLVVPKERLGELTKLVGKFKLDGKEVKDARKNIIKISLLSTRYNFLWVDYEMKLPKKATKCKIVKTKVKARTEYSLVCER